MRSAQTLGLQVKAHAANIERLEQEIDRLNNLQQNLQGDTDSSFIGASLVVVPDDQCVNYDVPQHVPQHWVSRLFLPPSS
jgi:hypothetical protein